MMKNRFLFVAMLFAALSLGFASCDMENGNNPDDPQGEQTEQGGSSENNGGEETPEPADPYNGHAYVDLGLSVKWATCNVGATKPEEYGNYYAWGEVEPKEVYYWSTYKFMDSSVNDWTGVNKYTFADGQTECVWYDNSGNFIGDNKTTLDLEDDAAAVNMGGSWRMPTAEEQKELFDECTWTWTTLNGVNGYNVECSNGNSIFLPAAGYRRGSDLGSAGPDGSYWSSSLYTGGSSSACSLDFYSGSVYWSSRYYRYCGQSVRGVIE